MEPEMEINIQNADPKIEPSFKLEKATADGNRQT